MAIGKAITLAPVAAIGLGTAPIMTGAGMVLFADDAQAEIRSSLSSGEMSSFRRQASEGFASSIGLNHAFVNGTGIVADYGPYVGLSGCGLYQVRGGYLAALEGRGLGQVGLTHLTTRAGYESITTCSDTSGKIGGKWGIFALNSSKIPETGFWRSFNTLVPEQLTHQISIPSTAISAFERPIAWGPFSAYRRWCAGVHSTPLGSIDLNTGVFIRGEIFKNGVFRQATHGEWMKYYGHQFILDYGIDAGIYGMAGLGTAIVAPTVFINGNNWLSGASK